MGRLRLVEGVCVVGSRVVGPTDDGSRKVRSFATIAVVESRSLADGPCPDACRWRPIQLYVICGNGGRSLVGGGASCV